MTEINSNENETEVVEAIEVPEVAPEPEKGASELAEAKSENDNADTSAEVDRLAALEEQIAKLTEALEAVTQPKQTKKTKGSKPPVLNTTAELPKIEDDASLTQWQREELFLKKRQSWLNRQAKRP